MYIIRTSFTVHSLIIQYILQIQSLPEFTMDWDICQRLEQSVTEIVSCLPLIKVLSSAAMRPRHWKQVLRLCTKSISQLSLNPGSFVDMDFQQFIDLGLQGEMISLLQYISTISNLMIQEIYHLMCSLKSYVPGYCV